MNMSDQGHLSKRLQGRDPSNRRKRSNGQPHRTSMSTSTADPMISQDYNVSSEPFNEPMFWEDYNTNTMDWQQDGIDKLGSISSHTTSYLNADTPSGGVTPAMGGYVMVQNRSSGANSNGSGSHRTSEEASEPEQQAYYSPPWTPAAEFVVDVEAMRADSLGLPHEPQWILSDLETQKPEQRWNKYQQQPAASSSLMLQQTSENYSLYGTYNTSTTESSSPPPKPENGFAEPWSQTALRVPRYEPSFTAFGLSPEPDLESLPSPLRRSRQSHKKPSSRSSKLAPGPGRKEKPATSGWEHIVVEKGGLKIMNEGKYDFGDHGNGGRRKGKLPKEAKEKAARVRKVKACWTCWLLKVPCSEGEVCERCLNYCSKKSPSADQLCSRTGFIDYEETFFPDYLHSHLHKREIESLINEHSKGFIGDGLQVEVSTGAAFTPMKLETHFFQPKHGWESELLKQHHLTVETKEQKSKFLCRYSVPVGLMALSTSDVRKSLREHIEQMIGNPRYPAQTTAGDSTKIPLLILDEVRQYCARTESSLVRSALMLHAIHYFMGSLVTFTSDSAANVYERSPHYNIPPEPYLSSRLLNRQLKFVMHRIHREITREVLEGLEKSMRSRTKDAWGPSFAAILVLCLCIEGLQTAADTFVVCDRIKEGDNSGYRREQSRAACEDVEEYPYERCTRLFHEIFKTRKEGNGGAREGGFNPLRALEGALPTGLDSATDIMVRSIFGWVDDARGTLQELSERPGLLNYGYHVDPKDIKINNNARLAAKFLISFFAKDF